MNSCTPKTTVTFNEDGYGNGMTYKENKEYKYTIEHNRYKIFINGGYIYFNEDDFNQYFNKVK